MPFVHRFLYRRSVVIACAMVLSGLLVHPVAGAGEVRGELRSAMSESRLEGARVRLLEAGLETYTGANGRFRFPSVPPGEYTLVADYIGLGETRETIMVDDDGQVTAELRIGGATLAPIEVTGQLAGQARAINRQRAASNIVNVVAREEIGEFPDQNTAEALQRVPGLTLQRDQGEGRFVSIRGLDGNLNNVNINGQRIPSAENDQRQVALDIFPSDLIDELVVSKTITPDMDGDAIGGSINVRSLNAFDSDGSNLTARVEGGYNELRESWSPRLGFNAKQLFSVAGGEDNFGVAIGASYEDRELGSDNMETGDGWLLDEEGGSGNRFPAELEQRDYIVDRERTGVAVNLDFRPDDDNEYYLRSLFSNFKDTEERRANLFTFEDGYAAFYEDGEGQQPVIGPDGGTMDRVPVGKEIKLREETQSVLSILLGGENRFNDWTVDYQLGYAKAREEEPDRIDAAFVADFDDMSYTRGRRFSVPGPASLYKAGNYVLDEVVVEDNNTEDEEWTLALNVKKDMEFGEKPGFVKFGGKARLREKFNDETVYEYDDDNWGTVSLDEFATSVDYPFDRFGPGIDSNIRGYVEGNLADWTFDEDAFLEDSQAADFSVDEDVYAGYLMGSVDVDRLRVLGGLRVEYTDYRADGHEFIEDEDAGTLSVVPTKADNTYVDVLPNLQLRYMLNDRSELRGAITRTIARPNIADAAPFVARKVGEGEEEFEAGNPDLDPYRSTNLDVQYGFYPEIGVSAYTIGLFYKRIDDYIVTADMAGTDFNARARTAEEYITSINGGDARVAGVELAVYQQMSFLPSPFDGLLVTANYTYTDTEADLRGRDDDIPLPRSSEHTANFALGYEKYGLSLRAAVNYRDKYLDEVNDIEDPAFDRYADERTQVDLTASYDITDRFQIYAEAINVTDEPFYAYFGDERYNSQYDEFGATYKIGMNYRF